MIANMREYFVAVYTMRYDTITECAQKLTNSQLKLPQ